MIHEELTYGCHVYWRGEIHRVVCIEKCDKTEINAVCIELPTGVIYRDIKELKPIPITTNWLFTEGFHADTKSFWNRKQIWEKDYKEGYILLEPLDGIHWRMCVNYRDVYGEIKRIKYVHQLELLLNLHKCN